MDAQSIRDHMLVEHESLEQVGNALRAAIAWKVKPKQLARKISSVRFVAQSLQRYVERAFALEEHDGYMHVVTECRPEWTDNLDRLRQEHDEFRTSLRKIMPRLDRVSAVDRATFENLCHDLVALIKKLERHNQHENALLEDALCQEVGGEG